MKHSAFVLIIFEPNQNVLILFQQLASILKSLCFCFDMRVILEAVRVLLKAARVLVDKLKCL
jgi:hypothetical protein